jgi:hypothetical protein
MIPGDKSGNMNMETPNASANSTLRSYLEDLVDIAEWEWLSDLAKQGKVLFLASNLEIVEVGLALAEDDISKVRDWLADGWLYRPTETQILAWDRQVEQDSERVKDLASLPSALIFNSLIVQPFVLAKLATT